jgi:hypothetical protein
MDTEGVYCVTTPGTFAISVLQLYHNSSIKLGIEIYVAP